MIDRRIKFRHIQCFVEIVRRKSLKAAARHLLLTQPAISKTLRELEDISGATLLIRNRSGIALTPQGEVFLHFADMSLAALQQGFDGIDRIGKDGKTTLSVGALPSVAARLMPQVVDAFSALAPDVTLHIVEGPHGHLLDLLRQGSLDLVLGRLGQPEMMTGIAFTTLYDEYATFVVRKGHPLEGATDMRLICDWPVVFPPSSSAIGPLVERVLIAHGIGELPYRIDSVSGAFGRTFTRTRDAIWIISSGVVANDIAEGSLVPLPFDTSLTKGPVGLMTRPDRQMSSAEHVLRVAVNTAAKQVDDATNGLTKL